MAVLGRVTWREEQTVALRPPYAARTTLTWSANRSAEPCLTRRAREAARGGRLQSDQQNVARRLAPLPPQPHRRWPAAGRRCRKRARRRYECWPARRRPAAARSSANTRMVTLTAPRRARAAPPDGGVHRMARRAPAAASTCGREAGVSTTASARPPSGAASTSTTRRDTATTRSRCAEHQVERRQRQRAAGEHHELPRLDAEVEAEQRDGDRARRTGLGGSWRTRAVHQPEDPGEHRPVPRRPTARAPIAHQHVLDPGRHDRDRDQELDRAASAAASAPVTASASVIEWPTVNAVTTQSASRQSRTR